VCYPVLMRIDDCASYRTLRSGKDLYGRGPSHRNISFLQFIRNNALDVMGC